MRILRHNRLYLDVSSILNLAVFSACIHVLPLKANCTGVKESIGLSDRTEETRAEERRQARIPCGRLCKIRDWIHSLRTVTLPDEILLTASSNRPCSALSGL